jgi:hypothetical protein
MATHDLSELWTALRTAMLADSTLVALLGGSDAIYRAWPNKSVAFPIIVIRCQTDGPPNDGGTIVDLWRPSVELDIYAATMGRCEAIQGRLDESWTIPHNKPAGVTSTNFALNLFKRRNSIDAGVMAVVGQDVPIRQLATEWNSRVSRR